MAKTGHSIIFYLLGTFVMLSAYAQGQGADLPNFQTVHPYLLRGGEPSGHGLQILKNMGVVTIVDLRAPTAQALKEKAECARLGMQYENFPMSSKAPTEKQVESFLSIVNNEAKCAKDSNSQNVPSVFVHCAHGSDRTGCMVGIFRVTHDHWSYPQAYKEMRQYYFGPQYKALSEAVRKRAAR